MSLNLSFIKPKNTLSISAHKTDIINSIVMRVKEIDNYISLKFENELLIFVCNCIENVLENKKVDKKELALEILDRLFSVSGNEKLQFASSIDFLCNNNLVQKIPSIQKYSSILSNYIKRKL